MSTTPPVSNIPLWGQAWTLTVQYVAAGVTYVETISTNAWEPESLRITFEVTKAIISTPWWYADIVIYNLDNPAIQNILKGATWVTLSAGFQTGPTQAGVIWDGPVFQILYDKEDIVDSRVTLHCISSPLMMAQPLSFSLGINGTQQDLIAKMATANGLATLSTKNGNMSPHAQTVTNAKQYPRGNTMFNVMGWYMDLIAQDQNLSTYRDGRGAYLTEVAAPNAPLPTPSLVYCPPFSFTAATAAQVNLPGTATDITQTIIGTPRQTAQGVIFTVLLDPRLIASTPPIAVQLTNTLFSQYLVSPSQGSGNLPTPYSTDQGSPSSANLVFYVTQVRHVGDSRGNDWYTEVIGYNTVYAQNLNTGALQGN